MRTFGRLILMLIVVGFVWLLVLGLWPAALRDPRTTSPSAPTGTSGTIDPAKARERAADIGEKAAVATQKIQETVAEPRSRPRSRRRWHSTTR